MRELYARTAQPKEPMFIVVRSALLCRLFDAICFYVDLIFAHLLMPFCYAFSAFAATSRG